MKLLLKKSIFVSAILTLFTGCYLKSVHPLIPLEQAILVDGIEGRWETEDQRWTIFNDMNSISNISISGLNVKGEVSFSAGDGDSIDSDENTYFILFENLQDLSSDTTFFIGSIGEINNQKYMDLSLFDLAMSQTFENYHLLPVHTFSRINIDNDELSLEFFKDSWIKSLIESNRVRIKYEKLEDDILITASSEELQKFVEKYGDDEKAYEDAMILKKQIQ
jgi:hypothetical protein